MSLILYHMPGACSRVTMSALEEIGLAYEDRPLDLMAGQQRSPEYLAVNPAGKIPALVVDGTLLTENAAILLYLHRVYPDAGLLPQGSDPIRQAQETSQLIWCSATLHPLIRSIRMPMRLTEADPAPVKARGMALMEPVAKSIAERLERGTWWLGDSWSILDVYIYWNYDTARSGGFDLDRYPVFAQHAQRVRARTSFQRALAREQCALDRAGIQLPPDAQL
jgi:glutathione S-transferase